MNEVFTYLEALINKVFSSDSSPEYPDTSKLPLPDRVIIHLHNSAERQVHKYKELETELKREKRLKEKACEDWLKVKQSMTDQRVKYEKEIRDLEDIISYYQRPWYSKLKWPRISIRWQ